jgi:hypothetical protein
MNARYKDDIRAGCAAVLVIIALLVTMTLGCVSKSRVPHEIPLGTLLETQANALGPQWAVSATGSLFTDSDFTYGAWTYWTGFDHADYRYSSTLEFHTFRSPGLAKRWLSPSPMAVNVDKDGNPPTGWNYIPPHADRFILDCTPYSIPSFCYALIVYQEYSIVYGTDMAGAMTVEDLQRMLQATDDFMFNFLTTTRLERGRRQIPTLSELKLE